MPLLALVATVPAAAAPAAAAAALAAAAPLALAATATALAAIAAREVISRGRAFMANRFYRQPAAEPPAPAAEPVTLADLAASGRWPPRIADLDCRHAAAVDLFVQGPCKDCDEICVRIPIEAAAAAAARLARLAASK
jgi:hypothetical protein